MTDITIAQLATSLIALVSLSLAALFLSVVMTPIYTYFAYRYRFWKRQRSTSTSGEELTVFTKLHADKFQRNIPTMAGLIIVIAVALPIPALAPVTIATLPSVIFGLLLWRRKPTPKARLPAGLIQ